MNKSKKVTFNSMPSKVLIITLITLHKKQYFEWGGNIIGQLERIRERKTPDDCVVCCSIGCRVCAIIAEGWSSGKVIGETGDVGACVEMVEPSWSEICSVGGPPGPRLVVSVDWLKLWRLETELAWWLVCVCWVVVFIKIVVSVGVGRPRPAEGEIRQISYKA